jgi:hypothetical protein
MKLYQNLAQAQKALAAKDAEIERLRAVLKEIACVIIVDFDDPAVVHNTIARAIGERGD